MHNDWYAAAAKVNLPAGLPAKGRQACLRKAPVILILERLSAF